MRIISLLAIILTLLSIFITLPASAQLSIEDAVIAIDWSPNGQYIATADYNGNVRIWDAGSGTVLMTLLQSGPPQDIVEIANTPWSDLVGVAWSPDGSRLAATNDDKIEIWDTSTWLPQLTIDTDDANARLRSIAWSPDGTLIASVSYIGSLNNFRLWNTQTGDEVLLMNSINYFYAVVWIPNSNELATASGNRVQRWSSSDTERLAVYIDTGRQVLDVTFNPSGDQFVTVGDTTSAIWDLQTGEVIRTLEGQGRDYAVRSVDWSPDDTQIATASDDGSLWVWNANDGTGSEIAFVQNGVYEVAWSPDGSQIAYGGAGNTFEIIPAPNAVVCDHDISASDTAILISTITTANGSGNPTTICLAQDSTYTFTTANNYLNAMPYITGDITIEGNNATITRSGTEAFRFFEVETGGKLTLNDLTLSNGDVSGETERGGALMNDGGETILNNVTFDGNLGATGGAIDNEAGTLTINDSTFTNNGGAFGGAIDNDDVATLTISGSTFTTNHALYNGGAIHNDGGMLTVSSTTFTTNTADDYGGAIDNDEGDVTINASIFTSNSSEGGGAIRNDGTLTINAGSVFNTNSATNLGWGGAIYNKSGTTLIINATDFSGNTADDVGGAIRNQGDLTVNAGSSFDGNAASDYGGAIYNTGGTVHLTGVQITNNTATAKDAGGIYGNSSSSLTITDSTLDGNDSGRRGGGIWSSGNASLTNVHITNNTAVVEGGGIYGSSGATISAGNSCISGNSLRAVYSSSSTDQNFENNWWGATDGPSGSGSGSGDAINSAIDYDPFITTSCPLP